MNAVRRLSHPARILLALLVFAWPAAGSAADTQGARGFIAQLGEQTLSVLRQGGGVDQFRQIFRAGFDIPTIGQFVLGRYWPAASPAQRQEYLSLFEEMVVQTYARRFGQYAGETFQVTSARPEGERDVMVDSQIVRPSGPPVTVTWRVRDRGGAFQIVDVVVEGVSMGLTQRNEFSSVIQSGGGNIDYLLQAMRNQIAAG